jgi:hypothetical protein
MLLPAWIFVASVRNFTISVLVMRSRANASPGVGCKLPCYTPKVVDFTRVLADDLRTMRNELL